MSLINFVQIFGLLNLLLYQNVVESLVETYKKAAVASDNGQCSKIGKEIMEKGGNAVESIIATAICIGVINMQSSGLGGGHFLTVYQKGSNSCTIIDAREEAPSKLTEDLFKNETELSKRGWLAIAVPGEIYGFWTAYKEFGGKIPWKDLWLPTIELCRKGFQVSLALQNKIIEMSQYLTNNADFDFLQNSKTGSFVKHGDTIALPLLADTMEKLANSEDPVKLFYDSHWTDQMIEEFKKNGGIITRDDMKSYRAKTGSERPSIYGKLKSRRMILCSPPPPSSGSLVTLILGILDHFNTSYVDPSNISSVALLYHRYLEASKFAYGLRAELGDIDFVPNALNLSRMINEEKYLEKIARIILNNTQAFPSSANYENLLHQMFTEDHGTTHMSVMDSYGNAASMTSTINIYFGSIVRSKVTGIIYNNQIDDFSLNAGNNFFNVTPSEANRPKPGKRPHSSMSPLIGFDDELGLPIWAIGAAGGINIIGAVAQTLTRSLYFNQTIKKAIDMPRIYNQLNPYPSTYEPGFPKEIVRILNETYGQQMSDKVTLFEISVCGIRRLNDGTLEANSDYRKGGGDTAGF